MAMLILFVALGVFCTKLFVPCLDFMTQKVVPSVHGAVFLAMGSRQGTLYIRLLTLDNLRQIVHNSRQTLFFNWRMRNERNHQVRARACHNRRQRNREYLNRVRQLSDRRIRSAPKALNISVQRHHFLL